MSVLTADVGTPSNVTATGAIVATAGHLIGFYVNSTSSGTIVIKDGTANTGAAISGTITPAIGFHRFPASFTTGLYVTIGATLNVTLFWVPA